MSLAMLSSRVPISLSFVCVVEQRSFLLIAKIHTFLKSEILHYDMKCIIRNSIQIISGSPNLVRNASTRFLFRDVKRICNGTLRGRAQFGRFRRCFIAHFSV